MGTDRPSATFLNSHTGSRMNKIESKKSVKKSYIIGFLCPLHGLETQVLCWRAFQESNRHLWQKYERTLTPVEFGDGELELLIAKMQDG